MTDLIQVIHNLANAESRRTSGTVVVQALLCAAILVPLIAAASYGLAWLGGADHAYLAAGVSTIIACAGSVAVIALLQDHDYPHDSLGLCNVITFIRGAGVVIMAGLIVTPDALQGEQALGWTLVLLALATLGLDGADGWVARRSGLQSRFGARLDVEFDVAFALVLALLAWQADKVGLWFVALGLLRPAFLTAGLLIPALRRPLPARFWRKAMAALQMSVQVLLLVPFIQGGVAAMIGASLLAVMLLSFAVDIRWLLRDARHPR